MAPISGPPSQVGSLNSPSTFDSYKAATALHDSLKRELNRLMRLNRPTVDQLTVIGDAKAAVSRAAASLELASRNFFHDSS